MTVRATHQWIDVIRGGDANVRITRQYIEVLVTSQVFEETCSESITVSDSANGNIFTKSISESITINDIVRGSFFIETCSETITIDDTFYVSSTYTENLEENIVISDTVAIVLEVGIHKITESIEVFDFVDAELDGNAMISRSAIESITLSDTVSGVVEITVSCSEYIYIDDVTEARGSSQNIMTQHFDPDDFEPKTYLFTDPIIGLTTERTYIDYSSIQDIIETELVRNKTIQETIVVNDSFDVYLIVGAGDYEETCSESITVNDIASVTDHLVFCTENITITDSAIPEQSLLIVENITVIDSAIVEVILNKVVTESISIGETLGYEVISGISLCTYSPFIGGSSDPDAPTPPSATAPTETPQGDFQLYYPVIGPTDTVTLRGPEPGDHERLHFQRIKSNSRGLSLHIYADPQWPKVKRLAIGVDVCTEAKAQEVLDFVTLTMGQEIGFRDWRNRSWKGIIDNPQNPVVRSSRGSWTIAIEFEAEMTEL